jgi:Flp pilus assembly protein TadD
MEQFVLPLSAFDVTLLPPEARDPRSPAFRTALDDYFRQQFRTLGANGVVQITAETLSVGWITPGFQPVDAAIALCQRGQVREGVQLLELARTRTPDSPNLLLNLGIALNELREFPRAVPILEHLVDLHPDHARAWVALAVALGHVGRPDDALDAVTRALDLDPQDRWAHINRGGLLFRLGRSTEARTHLEVAVQLAPHDAHTWRVLADICVATGDPAAARQAYQRVRTLDPHGPLRDVADAALNQLASAQQQPSTGVPDPAALDAMTFAVRHLRSLPRPEAQRLTLQAALLGQHGLRLQDPALIHNLDNLPNPLTALEVACLIHAGLQMSAPGTDSGFPLEGVYKIVTRSNP